MRLSQTLFVALISLMVSACGGTDTHQRGDAGAYDALPSPLDGATSGKASDAQIVFEAPVPTDAGSAQEIFTMNLDGSNRTQITHDGLNKFLPHFSPRRDAAGLYQIPGGRTWRPELPVRCGGL